MQVSANEDYTKKSFIKKADRNYLPALKDGVIYSVAYNINDNQKSKMTNDLNDK